MAEIEILSEKAYFHYDFVYFLLYKAALNKIV